MARRITIVTDYVYLPTPKHAFDWAARLEPSEPGDPVGFGPTEADAVYSLMIEIEAKELDEEEELKLLGQR